MLRLRQEKKRQDKTNMIRDILMSIPVVLAC